MNVYKNPMYFSHWSVSVLEIFKIPIEDPDKYIVGVDKYDMNGNYIKTYKSIYEAENDSVSNKSEIYRVASGDRKSSRNEKWKFTKTA